MGCLKEEIRKGKYLYHITKTEYLDSILDNGLQPRRGQNCKIVRDKTPPVIFLCTKDKIVFFYKNFNHYNSGYDCVLKVDVTKYLDKMKIRRIRKGFGHNCDYDEFGCFEPISPDNITIFYNWRNDNAKT